MINKPMPSSFPSVGANNHSPSISPQQTPQQTPQQPQRSPHHRRSIRLKDYDYSQYGAYFVTICAQNRECLFGEIIDGAMVLNKLGQITHQCWQDIPKHFPQVELDEFVIMPNHVHGIICIVGANNYSPQQTPESTPPLVRANDYSPLPAIPCGTSKTIGSMVRGFKIGVKKCARLVRENNHSSQQPIWQRNYYEHIIRDESSLDLIREYINNNPLKWELDENNPVGANNYSPSTSPSLVRANNHSPQQGDKI